MKRILKQKKQKEIRNLPRIVCTQKTTGEAVCTGLALYDRWFADILWLSDDSIKCKWFPDDLICVMMKILTRTMQSLCSRQFLRSYRTPPQAVPSGFLWGSSSTYFCIGFRLSHQTSFISSLSSQQWAKNWLTVGPAANHNLTVLFFLDQLLCKS